MLPTAIYTPSSKAIYTLPLLLCCWLEKILTLDVFGSVGCSSAVARLQDRLFPASFLEEEGGSWATATATALTAGLASWVPG